MSAYTCRACGQVKDGKRKHIGCAEIEFAYSKQSKVKKEIKKVNSVYAISPIEERPVKIGYTNNLRNRLIGIQTGNWNELYLRCFTHVTKELAPLYPSAGQLERDLHKILSRYRIRYGEWFDISIREVERLFRCMMPDFPVFCVPNGIPSWELYYYLENPVDPLEGIPL